MRTLIATWLVTLAVVSAVIVWLQATYEEPSPPATAADAAPELPQTDAVDREPAPADTPAAVIEEMPGGKSGVGIDRPSPDAPLEGETSLQTAPEETAQANGSGPGLTAAVSPDELYESGPYGPIPVTVDGTQPWRAFAHVVDVPDSMPRIAIVLSGLGLNSRVTQQAILETPAEVTLAFSPYGQNLNLFADDARRLGHEYLVMVPMEPMDYPVNDPGPHSLLTTLSADENVDRLHFALARIQGYVGILNDMGSRFTSSGDALRPVMSDLQRRGLMFVDGRSTSASVVIASAENFGVPWAENSLYIDHRASARKIDERLEELESIARINGLAVGVGHPYPVTVERIIAWAPSLADKGIALVPITAAANKRTVR